MEKSFQRFTVSLFTLALLALTCLPVWAKPQMEINLSASKEVFETVNGARTAKRVPATTANSGDVITYTLAYSNKGNETATDAVVEQSGICRNELC